MTWQIQLFLVCDECGEKIVYEKKKGSKYDFGITQKTIDAVSQGWLEDMGYSNNAYRHGPKRHYCPQCAPKRPLSAWDKRNEHKK